jgi:hypothetical protein
VRGHGLPLFYLKLLLLLLKVCLDFAVRLLELGALPALA